MITTDMKIGLIDVDGYPKKKRNNPYAYPLKKVQGGIIEISRV